MIAQSSPGARDGQIVPPPLAVIAELTYRCPLKCVYCSNPLEMAERARELAVGDWKRLIVEARALGAHQIHFTGGEPAAKPELVELVAHARANELYVNLITSGVGVNEAKLDELVRAGVDHVQLSFQDATETGAELISGTRTHALKLAFAEQVARRQIAFTVNLVVHRQNLARLADMIAMAEHLGAQKLEIAHVQYNGWALANRAHLLPTPEQVKESSRVVEQARKRLGAKMRIDFVTPDYHAKFPKACMGGWGRKMMLVSPYGLAMPCHSATTLPGLDLPDVRDHTLAWIWNESPAFNHYRGDAWLARMKEPCRSCDRREQDHGGCHCQAYALTGDADIADPVCSLAPGRPKVDAALAAALATPPPDASVLSYRKGP